jgi:hypothetical protein
VQRRWLDTGTDRGLRGTLDGHGVTLAMLIFVDHVRSAF